jgi:hypothetical protein
MSDEKPRAWQSFLASFLALALVGLSLVGLYILSMGAIGLALLVGGGLFLMVAFHYVVWGWWLGPAIHREAEADDDDEGTNY